MILKHAVTSEVDGRRLDEALALLFDGVSKSEARRIIDRGGCTINAAMVRVASRKVTCGDVIYIGLMEPGRYRDLELPPEALLYEDSNLIVLNKPSGVNSQRTPYQLKGTLEYWVSEYLRAQGLNEPARIVHRLDRGTSGVMLFPKNRACAAWLSARFQKGEVGKRYLALVSSQPPEQEWQIDAPIGPLGNGRHGVCAEGRSARTDFRLLGHERGAVLVEAFPRTGRTHQIRVHLAHVGLPIIGDAMYGGISACRMMLHCAGLSFRAKDNREMVFSAVPDGEFRI